MTAPIVIVIDVAMARSGATDGATSYTDRDAAQEWFTELAHDDKDVRMIAYYGDEPTADHTSYATELAALAYLNANPDADVPAWVYATDAYDDWLKSQAGIATEARREANHVRACRANL